MTGKRWIYRRKVAELLQCSYAQVPAIAEANNIRRIVVPGQYTKYHREDVLDLAASCIQGKGRVIAAESESEIGSGSGQILAEETGAAPVTTTTKKAGCVQR